LATDVLLWKKGKPKPCGFFPNKNNCRPDSDFAVTFPIWASGAKAFNSLYSTADAEQCLFRWSNIYQTGIVPRPPNVPVSAYAFAPSPTLAPACHPKENRLCCLPAVVRFLQWKNGMKQIEQQPPSVYSSGSIPLSSRNVSRINHFDGKPPKSLNELPTPANHPKRKPNLFYLRFHAGVPNIQFSKIAILNN
jgi:hypothetical protein